MAADIARTRIASIGILNDTGNMLITGKSDAVGPGNRSAAIGLVEIDRRNSSVFTLGRNISSIRGWIDGYRPGSINARRWYLSYSVDVPIFVGFYDYLANISAKIRAGKINRRGPIN